MISKAFSTRFEESSRYQQTGIQICTAEVSKGRRKRKLSEGDDKRTRLSPPIESLVIREGHSVQTRRTHVERIVRDLYARFCSLSCVGDALRMQSHVELRERLGTYACPSNRVDILHNVRLCVTPFDFFKISCLVACMYTYDAGWTLARSAL